MRFTQEEQVIANAISTLADDLNEKMKIAERKGMQVNVTPTKIVEDGKEVRQIMVRIMAEISVTKAPTRFRRDREALGNR
jgi:glycerate-2-kinase